MGELEKLSVIIPVYNTEIYLQKCVDSILNQTYNKIEIILIDDGSTDKSSEICDEYARKNEKITVIHKENGGLISARKKGVEVALGDYIAFVDSDDWLDPDYYKNLLMSVKNRHVDMISSGLIYEWDNKQDFVYDGVGEGFYTSDQVKKDIFPCMVYDFKKGKQGIMASACTKIFDCKMLKKVMRNIDTGITYGEDGAVVYSYILNVNNMMVLHYSGYHYIQHQESMIHNYTLDSFEKIFKLQQNLEHILLLNNGDLQIKKQIVKYVASFVEVAVKNIYKIDTNEILYLFPYEKVRVGSRIVLYGAGDVGKSYWNCLKNGNYASVIAWVDKQYKSIINTQVKIETPEKIFDISFDYVVIAIRNEAVAKRIKEQLINNSVSKEKIVWVNPVYIGW